jgi:Zn-dependent metalloprotease
MKASFRSQPKRATLAATVLIVVLLVSTVYSIAGAQGNGPRERLAHQSQGGLIVQTDETTGAARFIEAQSGSLTREFASAGGPEAQTRAFLNAYGALFGVDDQSGQLDLADVATDTLGQQHVRMAQREANIPVFGAELVVHLKAGAVLAANGRMAPRPAPHAAPRAGLTNAKAATIAVAYTHLADGKAAQIEQMYVNPGLFTGKADATYLTYRVKVTSEAQPEAAQWVFVDAQSGTVRFTYAAVEEGRIRNTYNMKHGTSYSGATLVRTENQAPVTSATNCTVTDINNAHNYAGDTYNFYFSRFSRDSYDNAGAALNSYVCYSTNYQNAFWDGYEMTYGDGFAAAEDVVAHELSHAVTEHTSNLTYSGQSGALNESYSDIFGESVEMTNSGVGQPASQRWLMGENIPGIGAIRNMMNPPQFGDPDSTTSTNYYCGASDNGGVHTNSGVPNKAYALMVDGGTFNGKTISGIGLDKAVQIEYRANAYYLTASSKFLDNYNALLRSASDLYGTTSNEYAQVKNALLAVKMNGPVCGTGGATATPVGSTATPTLTPLPATATPTRTPVPGTATPTLTPLPATMTPTRTPIPATATPTRTPAPSSGIVNGGFESGRNVGWAETSSNGYALVGTGASHTGSYRAWLGGANNETDEITQNFTVPVNGGRLYYWYRINSSDACGYDYGYVRANTTTLKTYSLCTSTSMSTWAQDSVSLAAYAGQTITLRFRATTDVSYISSLYVDDVSFTAGVAFDSKPPVSGDEKLSKREPKPDAPLGPADQR